MAAFNMTDLIIAQITDDENDRARSVVLSRSRDDDDAGVLLDALGLIAGPR